MSRRKRASYLGFHVEGSVNKPLYLDGASRFEQRHSLTLRIHD